MAHTENDGLPEVLFKLKSWCDQWVSLPLSANQSSHQTLANENGMRESRSGTSLDFAQALITCQAGVDDSCLLALRPRQDGRYDLQVRSGGQSGYGLFLGFLGRRLGLKRSSGLDTAFAIHFADDDKICFRGGSENLYLSADPQGRVYTGPTRPRKWEWFTMLPEHQRSSSPMPVPVRVSLRGHNGRYLCTSHPTLSAHAEVPCCCEELLLEVGPLAPMESAQAPEMWTTIHTATGHALLSADPAGGLSTVPHKSARGGENFLVHMTSPKWPRVAIAHQQSAGRNFTDISEEGNGLSGRCSENGRKTERRYIGVESNGRVVSNRRQPGTWEQFTLELVSGSRVFLQGVNGRFLAGGGEGRTPVTCVKSEPSDCWQLRSHGDGLYTLILCPHERGRGEVYLFVDESGDLQQSSEPAVQFPATCSLFSLEPVTQKAFDSRPRGEERRSLAKEWLAQLSRSGRLRGEFGPVSDQKVVGFSIRTAGKVNGTERYLSVEPNGRVRASRTRVSRTEIFAVSDVNALAARTDPTAFPCKAAATSTPNPLQNRPAPPPTFALGRADVRAVEEAAARGARDRLRQKIQAAARALQTRVLNPRPSPATLQQLSADAIATQAIRQLPYPPVCDSPACGSPWGSDWPHFPSPQRNEIFRLEDLNRGQKTLVERWFKP